MYRKCDFKYSTVLFHVAFLMLWEHAFTHYIENLGVIFDSTFSSWVEMAFYHLRILAKMKLGEVICALI